MFAPYSIDISFRREGGGGMDYLSLTREQRRVFPTRRMETGNPVSTQLLKKIMVPSEGRRNQQRDEQTCEQREEQTTKKGFG